MESLPCVFRRQKLREEPCGLCGKRNKLVPVYGCDQFGECTKTRVKPTYKFGVRIEPACCLGCNMRVENQKEPCVYLGEATDRTANGDQPVFGCALHELCTEGGKWKRDKSDIARCDKCKDRLTADPFSPEKFTDPLKIYDRNRKPFSGFRDLLQGGVAFLLCGGPSAKNLPLELLNGRGCWTLAVNNVAGWDRIQPQAFTCSDPPSKFCDGIWRDPKVMKIIPEPKLRKRRGIIRTKRKQQLRDCSCEGGCDKCLFEEAKGADGSTLSSYQCPNTWGYERRSWLVPDDTFFTEPSAAWGNHNYGVEKYGQKKTVCTMLLGMRILYYLGARRIYLVGVDFHMDPSKGNTGNYSFGEGRTGSACESNNSQFFIVNEWLCKMQADGVFEKFGVEFYNTNPVSGLRAFPYLPFTEAIIDAKKDLPSEPFDLRDWYVK